MTSTNNETPPSNEAGCADMGAPELGASVQDELAYRLRQQELLSQFGMFALECEAIEETMRQATAIGARGLNVELCKFLMLQPDTGRLLMVAGVGWKDGVVGHASLGADIGSPAGYAFQTEQPVLSNHLADETRFRTPDVLVEHGVRRALNVPVKAQASTLGVLEVDSTNDSKFTEADFAFLQGMANALAAAIVRHQKNKDLAKVLAREQLLSSEMRHRVKNLFAVISSIITLSKREAAEKGDPEGAMQLLSQRIASLALASDTGLNGADQIGDTFDPVQMSRLMLAPYGERVSITGQARTLPGVMMTTVCLVVHELATNAVKYGALSSSRGSVAMVWSSDDDHPGFRWIETGGPALNGEVTDEGFGAKLVRRLLRGTNGTIDYNWKREGLDASVCLG